ncbi:MAG: hypothetical protein A3B66_01705 [Alphaproteobacteria bacterium RIFCSPHIGHO2_02_FULL_46_13]|nr:MAG: hypothetical protein A3B66_01705 [Alphaproteobacteria bacterium RIFCSPHIGHO2_02_FULL_46_13]
MSLLQSSAPLQQFKRKGLNTLALLATTSMVLAGCADAVGPDTRTANIPAPKVADQRQKGINENGEPIMYLPLGEDVLMPQSAKSDALPDTIVGPYELRGETLAGALQLIMDGIDVPVTFESETSLTKTITMTNLKGPVSQVVNDVCALANMYCSFQNGVLSVKDREIFTVTLPPIVAKADVGALLTNVSAAIGSITGETPIMDPSTRTIVYRASQRTAEMANRYFQRLRSNTAMIVYETYIWEVNLNTANSAGIKWSSFDQIGRFKFGINLAGATDTNLGTPVSIGLPTTGSVSFTSGDVLQFISTYGAVKTISQPQISVLSGSEAKLRVADKQNYVASITKTASTTLGGADSFSTTTATADTGFTLKIGSNWDNSSVYGTVDILLQELRQIDSFEAGTDATVQLPQTTERELNTTVRVRPGDMVLIAGLVRENDQFSKDGLGLARPLIPTSRNVSSGNTELVFLLRPRVVVFTSPTSTTPRKGDVALPDTSFTQPMAAPAAPLPAPVVAPMSMDDDMAPVTSAPQQAAPTLSAPATIQTAPAVAGEPTSSSIEIQPLSEVVNGQGNTEGAQKDPSVIVNYDVLGH